MEGIAAAVHTALESKQLNLPNSVSRQFLPGTLELLHEISDLRQIDLSENDFSAPQDLFDSVLEMIMRNTDVQRIDLSSCGLNEEHILSMAEKFQDLKSLRFLRLDSNQKFNPVSYHAVCNLVINSPNLTTLNLVDLDIDDQACRIISEAIMHSPTLLHVSFDMNCIAEEGGQWLGDMLAVNKTLQSLELNSNRMKNTGIGNLLSKEAAENTTLQTLSASRNFIYLLEDVAGFPRGLTSLNLTLNNVNVPGAVKIAQALKHNRMPLQRLYLAQNLIGNDGVCVLTDALRSNTTLKIIDLNNNMLTDLSLQYITWIFQINTTLSRVHISDNSFTEVALQSFRDSACEMQGFRYLEVKNCTLQRYGEEVVKTASDKGTIDYGSEPEPESEDEDD